MAVGSNAGTDDPTFLIDLGQIFGKENVEMDELDTEDIPDANLVDLMKGINENNPPIVQKPQPSSAVADDIKPRVKVQSKRFLDLNDQEIDEIADFNTKSKTKKETNWGVKVLHSK